MRKHIEKIKKIILTRGRSIAIISAFLLIISAFLPWGYTKIASVNGLKGDGLITIGIGVITFIMIFVKRIRLSTTIICGILAIIISIVDFITMATSVEKLMGEVGIGLYAAIIASMGITTGSIVEMIEERRKKSQLYYLDK